MMHNKLITTAVLAMVCLGADAKRRADIPGYDLNKHEISVGVAGVPTRSVIDEPIYHFMQKYDLGPGFQSLTNTYFHAATYEIEKATPLFSINYFYNRNQRWSFGASLSYESAGHAFYSRKDDSLINMDKRNIITAMAHVRLSWLNRRYVRMYSSIGMGRSFSLEGEFREHDGEGMAFAMQVVPIGISIGKKLYGFAETGIGTSYFGLSAGIGYRF